MMMQCENLRRGPWDEDEDQRLVTFVNLFGSRRWDSIARVSGLNRSGKSCRLRWLNYLRPNIKHGGITAEEEALILQLHACWGNKWSRIARRLPGRTDNEIKNYWRTHMRRRTQDQQVLQLQGCGRDNREHDSLSTSGTGGLSCDLEKLPEQIVGSGNGSADEMMRDMDLEVMKSPYESQFAEWVVSEFSSEHQSDESENVGRFAYECAETTDLWHFPCYLWRMDYENNAPVHVLDKSSNVKYFEFRS